MAEFFKRILGLGNSDVQGRFLALCRAQNEEQFSRLRIDKILEQVHVSEADEEFQRRLLEHKNAFLGRVSALYAKSEMLPWVSLFVQNANLIPFDTVGQSSEFQNKLYHNALRAAESDFAGSALLSAKKAESLKAAESFKNELISRLAQGDSELEADLRRDQSGHKFVSKLHGRYVKVVEAFGRVFEALRERIEGLAQSVAVDFGLDLSQLVKSSVNPAIAKIVYSSELNELVAFLNPSFAIEFSKLYELCYALDLMPVKAKRSITYFMFLDPKNYPQSNRVVII